MEFRIVALRGKDDKLIDAAQHDQATTDTDKPFARWVSFDPDRCRFPDNAVTMEEDGQHKVLVIDDELDVTGEMLTYARPSLAEGGWQIEAQLNAIGGAQMQQLTRGNLPSGGEHRQLAIIFDGEAVSVPNLQSEISDRFLITGNFSESEARFMAAILKTGTFPMSLQPEPLSEKKVPPKN